MNNLENLSPIDGRYQLTTKKLVPYLSEFGLIKYRVFVEIAYFKALLKLNLQELKDFPQEKINLLEKLVQNFDLDDAKKIKTIEAITNHDVKAVEYYLKEKFVEFGLSDFVSWIHFGLTSQDINNTAIPLLLRDAIKNVILPELASILNILSVQVSEWRNIPMLARTHGQAASPTTISKEWRVFYERLQNQIKNLSEMEFDGKFGGATGNFNAHHFALPAIDWITFGNDFLNQLGLKRQQTTTQIEHYDNLGACFDQMKRINTILIDLSKDTWAYVSLNYFTQEVKAGEVGSSAMPHKVNPIDFENAEGNLGIANTHFGFLSAKLPVSRLQRDLTDSTVLRSVSIPIGHTLIALKSLQKGLGKLTVNRLALHNDLQNNWAVVAEAIQTKLRVIGYPNPYEALKSFTRGHDGLNFETIKAFIESLQIEDSVKKDLLNLRPDNYLGIGH